MKSVFISYVYEDNKWRDVISTWVNGGQVGTGFTSTAERGDFRQSGETAIKDHLRPLIRGAAVVVCAVGNNSHNHEWVQYELSVATSLNKQIILARIPETTGGCPKGYEHLVEVALNPTSLKNKLAEIW